MKKFSEVVQPHHVKFLAVGALGFVINFVLLYLLHSKLRLNLLISQLIAAEAAVLSNFFWHDHWTYKNRQKNSFGKRLTQFHASAWIGSGIATVVLLIAVDIFKINYLIGLVIGSGIALIWNYIWTNFVIWKHNANS